MILPTKHIAPGRSLLGVGAVLIRELGEDPATVNRLWEALRGDPVVATYERFILALDLLYIVGAVEFDAGQVRVVR